MTLHPHGLSLGEDISDHDIDERVGRLQNAPWQSDATLRLHVLSTLDVLAEHLVGRSEPNDDELKMRMRRLRARVADG